MTLLHQAAQKAVEALTDDEIDAMQADCDCFLCDSCDIRVHEFARAVESFVLARAALQQQPEPVEQPTLAGVETVSDADNQWFGDMMILQVLADSDCINYQEREVLTRWMTASDRPSALQHQEVPSEPVAADAKSILEQVANAPNEENCAMCNGRGFYGIPGQRCSFCKGTGRVQWRSAPDAASPSTTRQQEVGSVPALLFDGYYVYSEGLTDRAKQRTSPENVADVLDAVVRLMRAAPSTPENSGGVRGPDEGLRKLARHFNESPKYTVEGALRAATGGVQAVAPAQPLPGVETLRNVIECLRADARYVDEEGEATDQLQDLLDALRAPGVAMPWKPPPYPATPTEREALAKRRAALGVNAPGEGQQ